MIVLLFLIIGAIVFFPWWLSLGLFVLWLFMAQAAREHERPYNPLTRDQQERLEMEQMYRELNKNMDLMLNRKK